ncbi:GL24553, partial [Drosophila persimilis]
ISSEKNAKTRIAIAIAASSEKEMKMTAFPYQRAPTLPIGRSRVQRIGKSPGRVSREKVAKKTREFQRN